MSYVYRCGCVGEDSPTCPRHGVNHIIQSSASPEKVDKQTCRERKTKVILSKKKTKFNKKFNLVFLPSAKNKSLEKISKKGDAVHKHVAQFFAKKHLAVIHCEYDELAANLCSVYQMGYDDHQVQVVTSLRAYDIQDVGGVHQEYRGAIILFGTCDMSTLPKSFVHLGQLCLHESNFIHRKWVKNILHYDAHSFRPYLGFRTVYAEEKLKGTDLGKSLVVKTKYQEIFNLIERGSLTTDALRCIVQNG